MDYSDVAPSTECYDGPEAAMISFALDRVRAQLAWKTRRADRRAAAATHPPSTLTIASLIKHLTFVERLQSWRHHLARGAHRLFPAEVTDFGHVSRRRGQRAT